MPNLRPLAAIELELCDGLEREIEKYAYFPATLGLERDVLDLLEQRSEQLGRRSSSYLGYLNERAGTLSIYLFSMTKGLSWLQTA